MASNNVCGEWQDGRIVDGTVPSQFPKYSYQKTDYWPVTLNQDACKDLCKNDEDCSQADWNTDNRCYIHTYNEKLGNGNKCGCKANQLFIRCTEGNNYVWKYTFHVALIL